MPKDKKVSMLKIMMIALAAVLLVLIPVRCYQYASGVDSTTDRHLSCSDTGDQKASDEGGDQGGRYSCDRNSGSPAVPGCRLPSETGKKQNTQGAHYGRRTWADAGSERIA